MSSILSSELREIKKLEQRLNSSLECLEDKIEAWSDNYGDSLLPSRPNRERASEYLKKKSGMGEKDSEQG